MNNNWNQDPTNYNNPYGSNNQMNNYEHNSSNYNYNPYQRDNGYGNPQYPQNPFNQNYNEQVNSYQQNYQPNYQPPYMPQPQIQPNVVHQQKFEHIPKKTYRQYYDFGLYEKKFVYTKAIFWMAVIFSISFGIGAILASIYELSGLVDKFNELKDKGMSQTATMILGAFECIINLGILIIICMSVSYKYTFKKGCIISVIVFMIIQFSITYSSGPLLVGVLVPNNNYSFFYRNYNLFALLIYTVFLWTCWGSMFAIQSKKIISSGAGIGSYFGIVTLPTVLLNTILFFCLNEHVSTFYYILNVAMTVLYFFFVIFYFCKIPKMTIFSSDVNEKATINKYGLWLAGKIIICFYVIITIIFIVVIYAIAQAQRMREGDDEEEEEY